MQISFASYRQSPSQSIDRMEKEDRSRRKNSNSIGAFYSLISLAIRVSLHPVSNVGKWTCCRDIALSMASREGDRDRLRAHPASQLAG